MKCPRCGKNASLIFSYVKRKGVNEYTKEAFRAKRSESVVLRHYQCHHGHSQFLHKSNTPYPDEYAFSADRLRLFGFPIDWTTREEWERIEKSDAMRKVGKS